MTYYVVVTFDWDAEGELRPGGAKELQSAESARRRVPSLALMHAGVVAFSRTGDPSTGEFENAVIFSQAGEVDLNALSV